MRLVFSALAAATILASPAYAANLLVNGSFEGETNTYDLLAGGSNAIAGWTTTNQGVEWFQPVPYGVGPARDGNSVIDLAWYTSNGTPGGGIRQSFATVVGTVYTLNFFGNTSTFSGRLGTGIINAYIDGGLLGTYNVSNPSVGWTLASWQQFSTDFTATGTTTTLEFSNTQDASLYFADLDNVSVDIASSAVPESATWAMLLAGFGLVGGALRRRTTVNLQFV